MFQPQQDGLQLPGVGCNAQQCATLLRQHATDPCRRQGTCRSLKRYSTLRPSTIAVRAVHSTLQDLCFDTTFTRELPADPNPANHPRQVFDSLYSQVQPTPPSATPSLVAASADAARLLDLDLSELTRPHFALVMAGAAPLPRAGQPYSQCYGGHQWGKWAGQLGDGRSISLGEVLNSKGQRWQVQLKGAGLTPYSREGDGRAVLRSCVREFVASEAMHALGIPTTRALSLAATGDTVPRDLLYDGHVKMEPSAVLCRLAPSFVRFGTFQLPAARGGNQAGLVRMLADYMIRHHFPQLQGEVNPYAALLHEVCRSTGQLVALWQSVGFVHGVLNTDNMSVLLLTLDYGPFGFMDACDLSFTPNLDDADKRYCYKAQPGACQSNLAHLAQALVDLGLVDAKAAEQAMEVWTEAFSSTYNQRMANKLGLNTPNPALQEQLLTLMDQDRADFTNTFRALAHISTLPEPQETASSLLIESSGSKAADIVQHGKQTSSEGQWPPAAVHGGHGLPDKRLAAATIAQLLLPAALAAVLPCELLSSADRVQAWAQWLRSWRLALLEVGLPDKTRWAMQRGVSPKFVARQHFMQEAIEGAEAGDTSELEALMAVLSAPYDEQPGTRPKYSSPPANTMLQPGVHMLTSSL